jgi:hypothetical protein
MNTYVKYNSNFVVKTKVFNNKSNTKVKLTRSNVLVPTIMSHHKEHSCDVNGKTFQWVGRAPRSQGLKDINTHTDYSCNMKSASTYMYHSKGIAKVKVFSKYVKYKGQGDNVKPVATQRMFLP